MGAFLVVNRDPFVGNLADLNQIFKEIGIQDFMPIGSVEPLNKRVLAGFAGLDVSQLDAFVLAPLNQCCTAQLPAVF